MHCSSNKEQMPRVRQPYLRPGSCARDGRPYCIGHRGHQLPKSGPAACIAACCVRAWGPTGLLASVRRSLRLRRGLAISNVQAVLLQKLPQAGQHGIQVVLRAQTTKSRDERQKGRLKRLANVAKLDRWECQERDRTGPGGPLIWMDTAVC